jgi:hypothetical protein
MASIESLQKFKQAVPALFVKIARSQLIVHPGLGGV